MNPSWYQTTLNLLDSTELPDADICALAHVKKRWLAYVREGKYADPGINKMQRLHDVLVAASLESERG